LKSKEFRTNRIVFEEKRNFAVLELSEREGYQISESFSYRKEGWGRGANLSRKRKKSATQKVLKKVGRVGK